ncbi:putative dehydrogenase [Yersinia frederiksenii]|uniref:Tat pathway signal sequence domain protein n=2 Tax=Yersinia frederiksenii TaxID=29484 RepID=A0ABR4VY82_YERFR|nr:SDR family NAD(P)-dependent oxidoreductase [Yersinia frederiksenii]ATM95643.1 short-chain dehydrogenase [Yersinia frederiksenii]EEQ15131.1 Dehydrogenase with different specificities (related to short-chain alcohol Dehydrogenase) [Yersinia frederiksenii ATCC 33641]KGA44779.1 hypothetical protein DJ58_3316 [Yersinia frederiksenii ATCC 33641]SUP75724.1 putative dehydrogenase [Yersinia frederiksenii]
MSIHKEKNISTRSVTKSPSISRRQLLGAALSIAAAATISPSRSFAATPIAQSPSRKRIFITGSSSGLGQMAANLLIHQGHSVVLHGRSPSRASDAMKETPGAEAALYGDFTSLKQVKALAEQVNASGHFDAIIHNAGVGDDDNVKILTEDGLPRVFAINTLAPYVLTSLVVPPKRLIYMTSGMQLGVNGEESLDDLLWVNRVWNGSTAYSESKLLDSMLAYAVARCWQNVLSNTVEPGWVPTRMGGSGASDDLSQGFPTQAWLAVSDDPKALVTGHNFYHMGPQKTNPDAQNSVLQDRFLNECRLLSGVTFPQ